MLCRLIKSRSGKVKSHRLMAVSAEEFAALVREGVLLADRTYRDWTGGWGLADGGIEGFVSTCIAKNILDGVRSRRGPLGGFAALELTLDNLLFDLSSDDRAVDFAHLLDQSRALDTEIADSLKPQARLDLVYYDGSWPGKAGKLRPRGIVEVKRWFDKSTYPKDMRRISTLLNVLGPRNGGSLQYGCFVFFIFERDRARVPLLGRIDRINALKEQFQAYGCDCLIEQTLPPLSSGDPAMAAALSVTFEPR